MVQIVDKFFGWVDKVVERSSQIVCYLVFVIMAITAIYLGTTQKSDNT